MVYYTTWFDPDNSTHIEVVSPSKDWWSIKIEYDIRDSNIEIDNVYRRRGDNDPIWDLWTEAPKGDLDRWKAEILEDTYLKLEYWEYIARSEYV